MSLILASAFAYGQTENPRFRRLTTNQGLSQSHVSTILNDKRGFMWFGSEDGLNKFDGYNYTHYKHDPGNKNSIIDSYIQDLLEDRAGNLWVGTSEGLDRFDRGKNIFIHYPDKGGRHDINEIFEDSRGLIWLGTAQGFFLFDPKTGNYKSFNLPGKGQFRLFVSSIAEDNDGSLWLGTEKGLYAFDVNTSKFTGYFHDPAKSTSLSCDWIKALVRDRSGNIWIGTHGGGISLYDRVNNSFRNFLHDPKNVNSLAHNNILSLMQAKDGRIWIGTENGGISVYSLSENKFVTHKHNPADAGTLSNNSIYCIYLDHADNIWIGTYAGGVNFLSRFDDKFLTYRKIVTDNNSLSDNNVLAISGDRKGDKIWIGTDGGGLDLFEPKKRSFTHYRHTNNRNSISNDYVISIIQVSEDVIGLGFHNGGFDLFNTRTGVFKHHMPVPNDNTTLSISDVNNMMLDRDGNIWLGTWKGGLNFYDAKTGKITQYRHDPADDRSLNGDIVTTVFQDRRGGIWVGTYSGLGFFDVKTKKFIRYQNVINDKTTISNNKVQCIFEGEDGNLWIGTGGGGLNYFDTKLKKFTYYTEKEGLASNVVFGILRDKRDNLWMSTNKGISKFSLNDKKFRNYDVSDGLQGNEFRNNSRFETSDGQMFFGGVNGFSCFYPDSLRDNNFVPPVFITNLQIFNKDVITGAENPNMAEHISEAKSITLSHEQSVITFEFAALNYTLSRKNQYAYKLDGFDDDWNNIGTRRSATYTNLDPGTYYFRVRASNNDGVWNNVGTSVEIIITPPFWLTWWFRAAVVLLFVLAIIAFNRIRTYQMLNQQKELERQIKERTLQLERAVEEEKKAVETAELASRAKSSFLATMSHEIRTPMNGVIGLASLLAETPLNEEQKNFTKSIQACGETLLTVINDILDFSKIESGNMELEQTDFNLRSCIEEVMDLFTVKAAELHLDLIYQIDHDVPSQIIGDSLRLRQILMNLVNNAIKFTKKGEVFLKVSVMEVIDDETYNLSFDVKDTGIGIPQDKMDRLFKSFSQVDSSTTRRYGGTGLGLVICEKLVSLMGGSMSVTSVVGEGSTFHFSIRTKKSLQSMPTYVNYNMEGMENSRILVVDDNVTNWGILKGQLEEWKLTPVMAGSGKQALKILSEQNVFNLVITDMDMPEMNGLDLARRIRELYPQVPVILLSSHGNEVQKHNPGLFCAILTKPVKQNVLSRHIFTELSRQKKLFGRPTQEAELTKPKMETTFSDRFPLTILVAEDNKVNQLVIMNTLKRLGYQADLAVDGLEALRIATQKKFDLIFMDVQMPLMDGLEATQLIKKRYPLHPYIIAMTANALKEDRDMCLKAGMDDYISKPLNLDELMVLLEKWAVNLQASVPQ